MNLVFELFTHPVARVVVLGVVLIAAASALIGCFLFLRKTSLVGDAIAHASLPGVCAAFVVFESRHPAILLLGAMVSGWLSMQLINAILRRTKLKADVAIGIALSWLFGIGIVMLTAIQQSGLPNQNGLDHFLFGNAAGMQWRGVLTFGAFAVVLITFVFLLYRPWKLVLFDRAPRALPALVPIRRDFREWIVEPVLGEVEPVPEPPPPLEVVPSDDEEEEAPE